MTAVMPPDLEEWLIGLLRSRASMAGLVVRVVNKEPAELSLPLREPLIVIRDDSGSRLDHTTFDRSVGWSVLAGSRVNDKPAVDLARWVAGVLFDSSLPMVVGSPIASVEWDGCNGPYSVTENLDVTRMYGTAQYVVSGSW